MDKESKPRLTRLTAILTQLQSKRLSTAKEFADKHQVSIRTIYRDIRTLEESGVPIVTIEGKGYSLMNGYKLPPVMFTEEEANALITAEKLINQNQDHSFITHFQEAVTKIKSVMRYSQQNKVELLADRIQIRHPQSENQTSQYLSKLQSAIINFNLVDLHYLSLQNVNTERTVEPFAVYSTQGNWLLIAYCRLREEFRAFRLDHIQHLAVRTDHFEDHNMTLQEFFEYCRQKSINP